MSQAEYDQPTILVIIGITGDLAKRKLLPAVRQIAKAGALPAKFRLLGVSRRAVSADSLDASLEAELLQMDLTSPQAYQQLADRLKRIEADLGEAAQRLFYLSVPPQISQPIINLLGQSGLAAEPNTKLLLEKPFGVDLASAQELVENIRHYFRPEQTYRIDHYLAKEMAQNIIVFRGSNSLISRTWNKDFIESIEIRALEDIDIEHRAAFYEQTGALRDFIQSHLLQLAALTLMDIPSRNQLEATPAHRLKALRQLHVKQPIGAAVRRGQYQGYQDEVGNPGSAVETYVQLDLESTDPRWEGVPIRLTTGKALNQKSTEIRITYRHSTEHDSDQLVLRLQPNEGIELGIWTKVPGYEWKTEQHSLHHQYKEAFRALPEAYEQVLLDAIRSNHTLFTSGEEVLESWRILDPVQRAWAMSAQDLATYPKGATGID